MRYRTLYKSERLNDLLSVIESELGKKWLEKKVKQAIKNQKWSFNPIPRGWFRLKKRIAKQIDENTVPISDVEKKVIKLSTNLEIVRNLKNYKVGISSKRLKDKGFEKHDYTINIAALASRCGYEVRFIAEEHNKRTPDLHAVSGKNNFYIECKKKDPYLLKDRDTKRWKILQGKILDFLEQHEANFSVVLLVIGDLPANIEIETYKFLKEYIPKSAQGLFTNNNYGFSIELKILDDSYDKFGINLHTTTGGTYGVTQGRQAIDENGRYYVCDRKRIQLYTIDAHSIIQLGYSFKDARRQIPTFSSGVLYVDIDVTKISLSDLNLYLKILSGSIKNELKKYDNRWLGAIVISAEIEIGNYVYMVVRNENSNLSDNAHIPGEFLTK